KIKSLAWKEGTPYVWVACEFESMRRIRDYIKNSHDITDSKTMYISSYWKFERTEDQHRIDKRIDAGAPRFIQILWDIKAKLQQVLSLKR
ncbi:MAG: siderophore-interacting protein, partial [Symploca sp. SIO2G7]|nr:siderophore-interacting protein [Symploca sp. SIO2G7]